MYDTRLFEGVSVTRYLNPAWVFEGTAEANRIPAPFGARVLIALRNPVRDIAPDDIEYERLFNRFECFISLVHADLFHGADALPLGHLARPALDTYNEVISESRRDGEHWPPLAAGFFEGDSRKLEPARTKVTAVLLDQRP